METKETAVALLKEWKSAKDAHSDAAFLLQVGIGKPDESTDSLVGVIDDLSRRLDEIAEAAGIYYVTHGEYFRYERFSFDYIGSGLKASKLATIDTVTAREQQAIQEWLLIKNENTKSNA